MPAPMTPAALAEHLCAQLRGGAPAAALLAELRPRVTTAQAEELLTWLAANPEACPREHRRLLQCAALALQPIRTRAYTAAYEWAGPTLRRVLGSPEPIAETWPFFSGPGKSSIILQDGQAPADAVTLEEWVRCVPEAMGPLGTDSSHGGQKYFFVKFLDPSDFPPFAYVGFEPTAVAAALDRLGARPQTPEARQDAFRAHLHALLWEDRQAVEEFAAAARPRVESPEAFASLKTAYKQWAVAQAEANWDGAVESPQTAALEDFGASATTLRALLSRMQQARRQLTGLMHRIDFEEHQAILIESPTLHAIAGLSLQVHPKTRDNFHPKDEAWLYAPVRDAQGRSIGWVLVEPQRTFDRTESGADFFTPFAWAPQGLGFRKPITQAYLKTFLALVDLVPKPREEYVRRAVPEQPPAGVMRGGAQWSRVIDEARWPYFVVRALRFTGPGEAVDALPHHSFSELHVTQGEVEVTLRRGEKSHRLAVSPSHPVLLPATLPYEMIAYRAAGPAHMILCTRPPAAAA